MSRDVAQFGCDTFEFPSLHAFSALDYLLLDWEPSSQHFEWRHCMNLPPRVSTCHASNIAPCRREWWRKTPAALDAPFFRVLELCLSRDARVCVFLEYEPVLPVLCVVYIRVKGCHVANRRYSISFLRKVKLKKRVYTESIPISHLTGSMLDPGLAASTSKPTTG